MKSGDSEAGEGELFRIILGMRNGPLSLSYFGDLGLIISILTVL